jgi:hypothetical protein
VDLKGGVRPLELEVVALDPQRLRVRAADLDLEGLAAQPAHAAVERTYRGESVIAPRWRSPRRNVGRIPIITTRPARASVAHLAEDRLVLGHRAALVVDQEQLQLGADRALAHAEPGTLQHLAQRVERPLEPPREALVVGVAEALLVDLDPPAATLAEVPRGLVVSLPGRRVERFGRS